MQTGAAHSEHTYIRDLRPFNFTLRTTNSETWILCQSLTGGSASLGMVDIVATPYLDSSYTMHVLNVVKPNTHLCVHCWADCVVVSKARVVVFHKLGFRCSIATGTLLHLGKQLWSKQKVQKERIYNPVHSTAIPFSKHCWAVSNRYTKKARHPYDYCNDLLKGTAFLSFQYSNVSSHGVIATTTWSDHPNVTPHPSRGHTPPRNYPPWSLKTTINTLTARTSWRHQTYIMKKEPPRKGNTKNSAIPCNWVTHYQCSPPPPASHALYNHHPAARVTRRFPSGPTRQK